MTDQEEEFVHFVSCIASLNNAWRLINSIKSESGNRLVGPAFRYALVEYSKPYRESRGSRRKRRLAHHAYRQTCCLYMSALLIPEIKFTRILISR